MTETFEDTPRRWMEGAEPPRERTHAEFMAKWHEMDRRCATIALGGIPESEKARETCVDPAENLHWAPGPPVPRSLEDDWASHFIDIITNLTP